MLNKENETFSYYFVTFSNLTMLGPIMIWWVTLALAMIGWIIGGLNNAIWAIIYFLEILIVYVVGSYFMWAFIPGVRALYTGDKDTF